MAGLNGIISFSLKNRLIVFLGALLVVIGGIVSARRMDVDVFPDLTAPTVVVMSDAHGMSAEEVERLVTFPIETSVNGATGVRRVRSSSKYGNSFVWVEFDWGTNVLQARQIVSEKLVTLASSLPVGVTPVLAPQSSVMGEILFVGLQSDELSGMELRTITDWTVKPALLSTGGVSQVTVIGGDYKQYQILADPQLMHFYGVRMSELQDAALSLSINSEGGVLRDFGNEYVLRGMGRSTDLEELGRTLVKNTEKGPVTLDDVADIVIGSAVRMGYASMDGDSAVIMSISKQPNVNTLKVTQDIESTLEQLSGTLPQSIRIDSHLLRQADYISSSVNNVAEALLEGAIFVILILFLFLGSFRTTMISVLAIPVSLLGTFIVLKLLGLDINTMTLGGMCIAIGSLVDDAIIDVENVYKRLRQNHMRPSGERRKTFDVVFEASSEIRSSMINATLIVMVAFIPLFFLNGIEGRLLKPLGLAFIVSLFVSLLVAMTLTPLLCRLMLTDDGYLQRNSQERKLITGLKCRYKKMLEAVLRHKRVTISAVCLLLLASLVIFLTMGRSFLPAFNEGSATIVAVTQPGTNLEVSNELGNAMEAALLSIPEVSHTARRTGRGELDEHSQTSNSSEIEVGFELKNRGRQEVLDEMREKLKQIPGISAMVGQPLGHRIDHMVSGTQAAVAIKLFGPDISTLITKGNEIKEAISEIEGLVDVSVEQLTDSPELQIIPDRDALAAYGITMEDFAGFLSLGYAGERISDIYEGQCRYDLVLRLTDEYTSSIDGLKDALIDTPDGKKIPLSQVAEIVSSSGPSSISRENVQRRIIVSANVSGRAVGSVVEDIKHAIEDDIRLDEGYRVEYGGQFESQRSASRTLASTTMLALLVIFLLLYAEFRDISLSALVMCSLPCALIGGVFAVWMGRGEVSIPAVIGFITLLGIAVRNGVLLISCYQHLYGSGKSLESSIIEGSLDRLNPILMTALTSALALIPMILSSEKPGNEIQSPMAIVVLGGLVTSMLLNIFVIPILYNWYVNKKK